MSNKKLEKKVIEMICLNYHADIEDVKLESNIVNDLEFDSLDSVEFIMYAEEEFDIEISDEDAEKIETVGQIVEYLKGRV